MVTPKDPQEVYLEPVCPHCDGGNLEYNDHETGRMWCEDDVWSGTCDNCGGEIEATRYVKAE